MTVVPMKVTVPVRITKRGVRFFELLLEGYSELEAMSIAASEHGPRLIDAPEILAAPRPAEQPLASVPEKRRHRLEVLRRLP